MVGALAYSSKTRGTFCETQEQAHLFDGIDRSGARLGGVTRRWRFDRMGTVVAIGSERVLGSFAAFAKHHGVAVDICPAYRAKRKGVVKKGIDFITRRWWRTAGVATAEQAQRSLDAFCETIGDARPRRMPDRQPRHRGGLGTTIVGACTANRSVSVVIPDSVWPTVKPSTSSAHTAIRCFAATAKSIPIAEPYP